LRLSAAMTARWELQDFIQRMGKAQSRQWSLMVPVIAGPTRNLFHQGLTHAGRAGFAIQLTGKSRTAKYCRTERRNGCSIGFRKLT
jgi:hypothetical protein